MTIGRRIMTLIRCLIVLLATTCLLVVPILPAQAATLNVAAGDTAGLIAAIEATEANGTGADTIILGGGTYSLTEVNNVYDKVESDGLVQGGGVNGLPLIFGQLTIYGAFLALRCCLAVSSARCSSMP